MLLLIIVFFVFSTCTVLLEYYAVQYYYRLREERQRKKNDCTSNTNETPVKSAAPALMETPTGSEGEDEMIPRAIVCPSSRHVSHVSAAPINDTSDVVSSQTIRKKETLPLADGSVQTIVHVRNRAVLHDGSVKETVTVRVLEEDGTVEKEVEQTTSNVIHPEEEGKRLVQDFEVGHKENLWSTPKKKLYSSPPRKRVPEGLLQPTLSPRDKQMTPSCPKQLLQYYSIIENPQILLPKNKYFEPKVAMDGKTAVVACKQSIHFFELDDANSRWKVISTIHMPEVYCTMSVAISKKTAVVGVPKATNGSSKVASGVVYIYEKLNNGWIETSKFVPPFDKNDNFRGANVGHSVDIDNDTIVIGAPSKDSYSRKGNVYVLMRCKSQCLSDGWVQHSQLKMSSFVRSSGTGESGKDNYGSIVSVCNNIIAVSDGEETVAVFQYSQGFDSYTPVKGNLFPAKRNTSCASLALTNDGGVFVGCESNIDNIALFYHKNHPGSTSGQYLVHQSLSCEEISDSDKKIKSSKCQISVCRTGSEIMLMATTSQNRDIPDQVQILKQSNGCWNKIAVIESHSDYGNIFGSSVAVSNNHIMIASSNNVYAYNMET